MEVMVSVGGLPVNAGGQFAFILFDMDMEKRNRSFGIFLHGELDLCALTIDHVST